MHVDVNKIEEIYETSQRGARKKKSNTTKIQNEWSKRKKNGGKKCGFDRGMRWAQKPNHF